MQFPHRRLNPLTGEWVLVSPQRLARPWQGETESLQTAKREKYDPACYLCPGNVRAQGHRNPQYEGVFVFGNDFAALTPQVPDSAENAGDLLVRRSEAGACRVICFSPRHDLDVAELPLSQVRAVLDAAAEQYEEFVRDPSIRAVTIFENRGAMMGASNPHPHGQIWANETIPVELDKEDAHLRSYVLEHGECLLCAYLHREIDAKDRVIYSDERTTAVVPYWAVWPFEALVIPHAHAGSLDALDDRGRDSLAAVMQQLTSRYDRLFDTPFPYSMGFHQQPANGAAHSHWHMHAHYYPPLLRSASVRKFMVGYELLAQPQRDVMPEDAAGRLRSV